MSKTYYVYYDVSNAQYYYYDAESTTRSWVYPLDGYVYEPKTLKPVYPPGSIANECSDDDSNYAQVIQSMNNDQDRFQSTPVQTPARIEPTPSLGKIEQLAPDQVDVTAEQSAGVEEDKRRGPPPPLPPAPTLNAEPVKTLIRQLFKKYVQSFSKGQTFSDYAPDAFNKISKAHVEQYITYSKDPISDPLLKSTVGAGKEVAKAAKEMYKVMVKYVEAPLKDRKEAENFPDLYKKLTEVPVLQEEAFCQVMKVLYNQKKQEIIFRGLHILLFLATFFCPKSDLLAQSIYTMLASLVSNKHKQVANLAVVCFIRFDAIFSSKQCNIAFHKKDLKELVSIPSHAETGRLSFGVSLWEIHWFQGSRYPNLPVPKIIHDMAEKLFELKAEETQGIFRLPGSMSKIESMISNAEHQSEDFMDGCTIHDLGSLFKQWFRDVPGCICGKNEIPKMLRARGEVEILEVANSLPLPAKNVLMYLIGFLRRLAKSADVTSMNIENLAMVFGPNIVWTDPNADPIQLPLLSSTANNFLVTLIKHWNVDSVYPVTPDMLVKAEKNTD